MEKIQQMTHLKSAQGKKTPPSLTNVDQIWLRLRRPFLFPQAGHECEWERYDADCAGCLLCGKLHHCPAGMAGCTCPLIETGDGGHVCLITGLCIPEVRSSFEEFVENASFETKHSPGSDDEDLYDRVFCVVNSFLRSSATGVCRELEQKKYSQKKRQAFWRVLRQCKRDNPYELPDLCQVVAEVARQEPTPPSLVAAPTSLSNHDTEGLVRQSTVSITGAIRQIYKMGFRKICQGVKFPSVVIGMLYMTRNGLNVGSVFNLQAVNQIHGLLPSETYLNCLGVSNKVICDTENEIKSCIRAFSESRASACAPRHVRAICASSAQSLAQAQSS
jgi:hypothetical protein